MIFVQSFYYYLYANIQIYSYKNKTKTIMIMDRSSFIRPRIPTLSSSRVPALEKYEILTGYEFFDFVI